MHGFARGCGFLLAVLLLSGLIFLGWGPSLIGRTPGEYQALALMALVAIPSFFLPILVANAAQILVARRQGWKVIEARFGGIRYCLAEKDRVVPTMALFGVFARVVPNTSLREYRAFHLAGLACILVIVLIAWASLELIRVTSPGGTIPFLWLAFFASPMVGSALYVLVQLVPGMGDPGAVKIPRVIREGPRMLIDAKVFAIQWELYRKPLAQWTDSDLLPLKPLSLAHYESYLVSSFLGRKQWEEVKNFVTGWDVSLRGAELHRERCLQRSIIASLVEGNLENAERFLREAGTKPGDPVNIYAELALKAHRVPRDQIYKELDSIFAVDVDRIEDLYLRKGMREYWTSLFCDELLDRLPPNASS